MKKITSDELKTIIEKHARWLSGDGGERADLRDADLRDADLRDADLRGAMLQGAMLQGANLQGTKLQGAMLQDTYLHTNKVWVTIGDPTGSVCH